MRVNRWGGVCLIGSAEREPLCRGHGGVPHKRSAGWVGGKNNAAPERSYTKVICDNEARRTGSVPRRCGPCGTILDMEAANGFA